MNVRPVQPSAPQVSSLPTTGSGAPTYQREVALAASGASAPMYGSSASREMLTAEEQKFFAGVFSAESPDAGTAPLYRREGRSSGAHLGTLIDRKG